MHGKMKREKITRDRNSKSVRRRDHTALLETVQTEQMARQTRAPKIVTIKPLTEAQRLLDAAIFSSTLTFAVGPAGVGKTWFTAARAAQMFRDNEIEKIIIIRPAVEAEENLGFLPGEMNEKMAPYFRPVREALQDVLGAGPLEYAIKAGQIEARPLAYMRGATFNKAFVLVDEAQNTTPSQMKLILTRIGEGSRVVVDGDLGQKDISGMSGLEDAMRRLHHLKSVSVIRFGLADIVRSGFCQEVVAAYDGDDRTGLHNVRFLRQPSFTAAA